MTSRRLWLLLTLLAAPLILYSTTGCQVIFSLDRPDPTTNAYTCGCSCNPGPRDVTSPVAADKDDAEENRLDGNILLGNGDLRMSSQFLVGVRFAALGIPQGAEIKSAYVQFTAAQSDPNPGTVTIQIQDSDDAPPFTSTDLDISSRSRPATPVDWTSGAWVNNDQGTEQRTSELSALIQTVVSRPGWTEASSLVLIFDATAGSRIAASADAAGNRQPVLHLVYEDPAATFTANIPVCLAESDNPALNPNAPNPDLDSGDSDTFPDVLTNDCANRVENTYKGLIGACGIVSNPTMNCFCDIVPTGTHEDTGDPYFGFTREICNTGTPVCPEVLVDTTPASLCSNFDPKAFEVCLQDDLAGCAQNSIPPEDCNLDDCLPFVAATNATGGDPICVAHASEGPQPFAFQLLGQRSTCEVSGQTEIQIGDEAREPKQQPLTQGTIEILGKPCPSTGCVVGISTQLAMNSITFDVSWASDPTFSNMIEAGNSSLSAASLSSLGVGNVAAGSTANVGRGQRGSNKQAFLGSNNTPLGLTVNWAGFACSLDGNLAGAVEAEGAAGTCDGDETVACFTSSPDCDGVGGPCNLPGDQQEMVVNVSLAGRLTNQPPTADAGGDQTVECTSPAGASFALDGSQSSDPDGDIRVLSWRQGTRVGPEVGFRETLPVALGIGQSETYVLRVIDGFAQADENTVTAEVVDTTPPEVFCNAPTTIPPPNKPISFTATATDVCTAAVVPQLVSFECFKFDARGRKLDKTKTCKVVLQGATITISPPQGVGNHIAWIARAVAGSGNVGTVGCEIEVVQQN
jgi:hypothetical protein